MAIVKRERSWPELFERMFDRPDRWFTHWPEQMMEAFDESWMRVEQYEEDGAMVVRAELPGIDPDSDVEITVDDNAVRIHAERRQEEKIEEKDTYRSEFRYGTFTRTLSLPPGATAEDVTASYTDGVLEVRIPMNEEKTATRRITVTRS